MKSEVQTLIDSVNKNMENYNEDIKLRMEQSDKLELERFKTNPLNDDEYYRDELVFFQAKENDNTQIEVDNKINVVKKLSKKFI